MPTNSVVQVAFRMMGVESMEELFLYGSNFQAVRAYMRSPVTVNQDLEYVRQQGITLVRPHLSTEKQFFNLGARLFLHESRGMYKPVLVDTKRRNFTRVRVAWLPHETRHRHNVFPVNDGRAGLALITIQANKHGRDATEVWRLIRMKEKRKRNVEPSNEELLQWVAESLN
jgi:hypothetical protein